jgi:hypothetical protein
MKRVMDKCYKKFGEDREKCLQSEACVWHEEKVFSGSSAHAASLNSPTLLEEEQQRRRLEEESRPEATNNRVSSCPDGLLPDTFNQPAHGRGLCSPKHGNFAYLGLAGGGQRAKAFAQGILRGMWLRGMHSDKYSMDRAAWPDNIGGNSGGTWGMMEVYTHGPKVVFGSEDSKTQEFWGRYVNPKKFGAVFNCMKEKHEDICFDPLHACNCGTSVPASFWDLTTPTMKYNYRAKWYSWVREHNHKPTTDNSEQCSPVGPRDDDEDEANRIRSYPILVASGETTYNEDIQSGHQVVYAQEKVAYRRHDFWAANAGKDKARFSGGVFDGTKFSNPVATNDGSSVFTLGRTTIEYFEENGQVPWCSASARSSSATAQVAGSLGVELPDLRYQQQITAKPMTAKREDETLVRKEQEFTLYTMDGGMIDNPALMPAFSMRAQRIVHASHSDLTLTDKGKPRDNSAHWNIAPYIKKCREIWLNEEKFTQLEKGENRKYGDGRNSYEQDIMNEQLQPLLKGKITRDNYQMFDIDSDSGTKLSNTQNNGVFRPRYHCAAVSEYDRQNKDKHSKPLIFTMALTVQPTARAIEFFGLGHPFQEYDVIYTGHIGAPVLEWEDLVSSGDAAVDVTTWENCGQYGGAPNGDVLAERLKANRNRGEGEETLNFFPHTTTQLRISPACTQALMNMATYSVLSSQAHYDYSLDIDEFAERVRSDDKTVKFADWKYAEVIDCRKSTTNTFTGFKDCLEGIKPLSRKAADAAGMEPGEAAGGSVLTVDKLVYNDELGFDGGGDAPDCAGPSTWTRLWHVWDKWGWTVVYTVGLSLLACCCCCACGFRCITHRLTLRLCPFCIGPAEAAKAKKERAIEYIEYIAVICRSLGSRSRSWMRRQYTTKVTAMSPGPNVPEPEPDAPTGSDVALTA